MKPVQYLLFISMLMVHPKLYSQDSIRAIVRGSLSLNWEFKLSIFVKELRGVLLYSIDNGGTQVRVTVTRSSSTQSNKISAIFNQMDASMSLLDLCGCDPCADTVVHLLLRFKDGIMRLTCNHREGRSIPLDTKVYPMTKKTDIIEYPVPFAIVNMSNVIIITMGNILPYNGTTIVYPFKEEPIGCVKQFYYNNESIVFSSTESTLRPSCPRRCSYNICNGGLCRATLDGITCDCSVTAQNGRYCNDSLMEYKYGGNNSYEAIKGIGQIYFKFTWRSAYIKHYCLLEIRNRKSSIIISVKGKILMLNSDTIINNSNGLNFITINISNNYLTVTVAHRIKEVKFTFNDLIHINVGYGDSRNECKIFEGLYDFNCMSSLKQSQDQKSIIDTQSSFKSITNGMFQETKSTLASTTQVQYTINSIITIVIVCFIITISILVMTIYMINRKMNRLVTSVNANTIEAPLQNAGQYSQVNDVSEYDYIQHPVTHNRLMTSQNANTYEVPLAVPGQYSLVNDFSEYDYIQEHSQYGRMDVAPEPTNTNESDYARVQDIGY